MGQEKGRERGKGNWRGNGLGGTERPQRKAFIFAPWPGWIDDQIVSKGPVSVNEQSSGGNVIESYPLKCSIFSNIS